MGKPIVTAIAAERVARTKGDDQFCQTCTAYIGKMGHGPKGCPGNAETHVARTHPTSVVDHDHDH